jgi:hypothetical protein
VVRFTFDLFQRECVRWYRFYFVRSFLCARTLIRRKKVHSSAPDGFASRSADALNGRATLSAAENFKGDIIQCGINITIH